MKCPVCTDTTLAMSNREGIEIDYCPSCRGVWLDRGELDKIIERSVAEAPAVKSEPPPQQQRHREERYDDDDDRRHSHSGDYHKDGYHKRKRKGLLGDLFDFD